MNTAQTWRPVNNVHHRRIHIQVKNGACSCQGPYLGVKVEFAEILCLVGPAVAVGERPQALQPLGNDAGKPLLPRQSRDEEDVLWGTDLVGAVCAAWWWGKTRGAGVLNSIASAGVTTPTDNSTTYIHVLDCMTYQIVGWPCQHSRVVLG